MKEEIRGIKTQHLEERRVDRQKAEEGRNSDLAKQRQVAVEYRELSGQVEEVLCYHSEMSGIVSRQEE